MRTCKTCVSFILPWIAAFPALAAGEEKGDDVAKTVPVASESAAPSPKADDAAKRREPPAPPRKYLETGARLYNAGRYELAAKYLEAAHKYRDALSQNERVVLDVYRAEYQKYLEESRKRAGAASAPQQPEPAAATAAAPVPAPADLNVTQARTAEPVAARPVIPVNPAAKAERNPDTSVLHGTMATRDTADPKQKARWLLHLTREQIVKENFDAAKETLAQARSFNVKWGLFEDSPDKVEDSLAKAKADAKKKGKTGADPRASAMGDAPGKNLPHDRRTARGLLREARAALVASQFDKAEAIVREVRSWNLRFSLFDDSPDKIEVAIAEARNQEAMRQLDLTVRSYMRPPTQPSSAPTPAPAGTAPSDGAVVPASGSALPR